MTPFTTVMTFASEGAWNGGFGALSRLSSASISSDGRKKGTYHMSSLATVVASSSATTDTGYLLIDAIPRLFISTPSTEVEVRNGAD
jgi:hypothetical protein